MRSAVKTLNVAWPHPRDQGEVNIEAGGEMGGSEKGIIDGDDERYKWKTFRKKERLYMT
jgi:hypothetical protein